MGILRRTRRGHAIAFFSRVMSSPGELARLFVDGADGRSRKDLKEDKTMQYLLLIYEKSSAALRKTAR